MTLRSYPQTPQALQMAVTLQLIFKTSNITNRKLAEFNGQKSTCVRDFF